MEELKNLAAQLRCPDGEHGVMVGNSMNETNIGMTVTSIDVLALRDGDRVLEIGYGNGGHVSDLMQRAKDLHYWGIDISKTMHEEAMRINEKIVQGDQVQFDLYDGLTLPYHDQFFDKIFTVNTVYFWEYPHETFSEIARVLKPKGFFALTFADKSFMQTLSFTQYGFSLYEREELSDLGNKVGLQVIDIIEKSDQIQSKAGDLVDRKYYVMVFGKG